ncbi:MAG: ABC transporter substrate-binding protein, partial [Armatimonadetes bacterium]|nr:ABC transporter substrate-binding protein [Armatimonadota bacterium]
MVDAQGHRKILIIAVIFLAAVLAVPGVPSVAQTRGGELRLGLQSEPLGLDPHLDTNKTSINYIEHLYSGLVQLDAKLNPVPDLATAWKQHNPTTYEFTLRRGVKFHSGRELTSEDVKYTFQRAVDPTVKSAKADYFRPIKEIQTPDPYTVRIILAQPFAPFLTYLAMPGTAGIVAKETVERHGNLKRVANGTGPFMFEEWAPG